MLQCCCPHRRHRHLHHRQHHLIRHIHIRTVYFLSTIRIGASVAAVEPRAVHLAFAPAAAASCCLSN